MSPLQNAGLFLVQVLFDFYIFIVLLRIVLQKLRVDVYHPLSQWVLKMTNPPLMPLRRYIPYYAGFDLAAIGFLLVLQAIKWSLLLLLQAGLFPNPTGLILVAIADSLVQLVNLFFYAILLRILLTWVHPVGFNPMIALVARLTDPLLQPVRRWLPAMGGFDITPIPVMIGLKLLIILLIDPLFTMGQGLL